MSIRKRVWISVALLVVPVVPPAMGCAAMRGYAERTAATRVFDEMVKEGTAEQVAPPQDMVSVITFRTGRLNGGFAIVCEALDAAFWVKRNQVFPVNEAAKVLLPKHPQAPPEITYEAVDAVAE